MATQHPERTDLRLPRHFDGRNLLAYLRARHVDPLEAVGRRSFARPLWRGRRCVVAHITFSGTRLSRATAALPAPLQTNSGHAAVRRLLGVDWDFPAFLAMARPDPLLGPLVQRFGWLGMPQLPDAYEALIRAILEQQVSLKAAATVTRRFIHRFGQPLQSPDDGFTAFPRAEDVRDAGADGLRGIGLTRAKERAIVAASEVAAAGALGSETPLTELPGVGPWTAGYVRMRALGDGDVFLDRDLGIRMALGRSLRRVGPVTPSEARDLARPWAPWRSHAMVYLWQSLTAEHLLLRRAQIRLRAHVATTAE